MFGRIDLGIIQRRLQVVQLVRIGFLGQQRRAVIVLEGVGDRLAVVLEVEHEAVVLLRMRAVEARKSLHGLDARERLVDIHRVQQRLVVAGLELVGADQEAVRVVLDLVGDIAARKAVERRLAHLGAAVFVLAGERDDGLIRALALREIRLEGVEVLDGPLDAARHHHGPRLSADLSRPQSPDHGSGPP